MNYFRSLYEFSARTLEGEFINFDKYKVRNVETAKLKKKNNRNEKKRYDGQKTKKGKWEAKKTILS